jgi:IS1 family transposase
MANNLTIEKKVLAVSLLAEGSSIRAIERITGVHRDTIMRLGVRVGEACARIHDGKMRGIPSRQIQIDEIWGFISKKKRQTKAWESGVGDVWTFIALDADTKLIPAYRVGQRTVIHAKAFLEDLEGRLASRIQLSSDGLAAYRETVGGVFGPDVDYAQLVKTYAVTNLNKDAASRYSPAEVVKTEMAYADDACNAAGRAKSGQNRRAGRSRRLQVHSPKTEKTIVCGMPDITRITTSHVEKQNHTLRMHCRRLTRLTNAFSKKLENFCAAVALNFTYYNFCKSHLAIRMTPAQAAGIESSQWTVGELIERCGE